MSFNLLQFYLQGEAEKQPDSDIQRRLLAAAKTLADATARMVEAARQCASHPHEVKYQDNLRRTAEDLRDVTIVAATTPALRAKLVDRVQVNQTNLNSLRRDFDNFLLYLESLKLKPKIIVILEICIYDYETSLYNIPNYQIF